MNPNRDDFDAVWQLVQSAEKMAIIGTNINQYPTREPFDEAYEERNLAMAKVMDMLAERHQ